MSRLLKSVVLCLRALAARRAYRGRAVRLCVLFAALCVAVANPSAAQTDFGDAPAPYPTLLSADGARHLIVQGIYLGAAVSAETDGQADRNAAADDGDDCVTFLGPLAAGNGSTVRVVVSVAGKLDAWIDFNGNGDWGDQGDQIFTSTPLAPGANILNFSVPTYATATITFARFRFSTTGDLKPTGPARDGEVEDYRVAIVPTADLCVSTFISPDPIPPQTIARWVVTIANFGPSAAPNVVVSNIMGGVEFLSLNSEAGACTIQNERVICSFGNMASGETRSIAVSFRSLHPALLTAAANVRSDLFDPRPQNNKATLSVRAAAPLVITSAPQSQKVPAGASVSFFVEAKGVSALRYQWYGAGAALADETNSTLTLGNVQASADYQVQVSDAFSSIMSPVASLIV